MDNIGIYCAFFKEVDDKYYIGQSTNLRKRIAEHKALLFSKKHKNYRLQDGYALYGMPEFEVLEICTIEKLKPREVFWIREFDSFNNGYNITNGGDGGGFGEGNVSALYPKSVYISILDKMVNSTMMLTEISKELEVSLDVIKHISSLHAHSWLAEEAPENYMKLIGMHGRRNNSAKSRGITYPEILSPEGVAYTVENIHGFCKEKGLQAQNLHKVLTGQRKHHKGWKLKCK